MPLNIDALRKEMANQPPFHNKPSVPTAVDSIDTAPVQQVKEHIKQGIEKDTINEANATSSTNTATTNPAGNNATAGSSSSTDHHTTSSIVQSGR